MYYHNLYDTSQTLWDSNMWVACKTLRNHSDSVRWKILKIKTQVVALEVKGQAPWFQNHLTGSWMEALELWEVFHFSSLFLSESKLLNLQSLSNYLSFFFFPFVVKGPVTFHGKEVQWNVTPSMEKNRPYTDSSSFSCLSWCESEFQMLCKPDTGHWLI